MQIRAKVRISGRVIMVGFRAACQTQAQSLGVTGWIKNKIVSWPIIGQGEIEAVFEGKDTAVYQLVEWCKKGPVIARVDKVEVEYGKATGEFKDFEIRY